MIMEQANYDNTENTNDIDHELQVVYIYRECLRNHAASIGSYATDGCGEFTLRCGGGGDTAADLHCAACGCHRNFHRKLTKPKHQYFSISSPITTAHDNTTTRNSSAEQMVHKNYNNNNNKKRMRTKFTPDQKQKMLAFAEKLGWRMQRNQDHHIPVSDDDIERFCRGIGVSKQVFKVWMHNHKSLSSSSSTNNNNNNNSSISTGNVSSLTTQ